MDISEFERAMLKEYLRFESELAESIEELKTLPRGYISKKNINGHEYPYLQYNDNGKIKSEYIKADNLENIEKGILRRKELQDRIRTLKRNMKQVEKALGKEMIEAHKNENK